MSLSVAGVWAVGVWDQTVWGEGVWREGEYTPPVVTNKDGAGQSQKLKKPPKKYKNKKIEALLESLMAERNALEKTEKVVGHGYIQVDHKQERKVEAIKIELLAAMERIEATTRIEIAYQKYIYDLIKDLEKKYKQAIEDELIAILLLSL